MPSPDLLAALAVAPALMALIWLSSRLVLRGRALREALGWQLQAGAAMLLAVALWWPQHLAQSHSLVVRAGWWPVALQPVLPVALALAALGAAHLWQSGRRSLAAGPGLLAPALAWAVLEADPAGTPSVPGLMAGLTALPLAGALTLPLLLAPDRPASRWVRGGGAAVAAVALTWAGWHGAAGGFSQAAGLAEVVPLLALIATAALVLQALSARPQAMTAARPRQTRLDGLTGLPMRTHFEARLGRALRACHAQNGALAVLQINLDKFKAVNDMHGFQTGDQVLEETARRLRRLARGEDTLARLAGNDFLLLLPQVPDAGAAEQAAEQIVQALARPFHADGVNIALTASVGLAMWPQVSRASRLIGCAELAMREAQRLGGGRGCPYTPALEGGGSSEAELVHDLRNAIAANGLELHFQPKVDAQSGKVTGAEALVRWRHPERGPVGPDIFVPLAERSGLIGPLGDWVIEEACRQSRIWRDAGLRMRVAINLSAHQLQQEDIVQRLGQALERHRVHPSLVTCEITETAAMQDTRMTQETFRQLGRMGVHVSIDDFGTGYSSLAYLRRLPAEELKIDRAFVTDLDHSDDARAIVDAVVRLAHALGLKVVAEGVETPRQQEILAELGCDEMQGYLFARPMTARALLMWAINDRQSAQHFKRSLFRNTMEAPVSPTATARRRRALADTVIAPREAPQPAAPESVPVSVRDSVG